MFAHLNSPVKHKMMFKGLDPPCQIYRMYSQKYWRELNLAVFTKLPLNLAVGSKTNVEKVLFGGLVKTVKFSGRTVVDAQLPC